MRIRTFGFIAAFVLGSIAIERLCHRATDGFLISNVQHALPYHQEWETTDGASPSILAQRFHYMGKGAQTFVLASEDGKYVLKFFKFHRLKESELNPLFQGYKLAFEEAKEESGLLFVHLNPSSHLKQKLEIIDRLGIVHKIDADTTHFVLQKRAELVIPTLKKLHREKNLRAAQQALASLLELSKKLEKRELYDHDAHLSKNYGFIGDSPILLDCGNLSKTGPGHTMKAGALRSWLGEAWPELSRWFEEKMR